MPGMPQLPPHGDWERTATAPSAAAMRPSTADEETYSGAAGSAA